MIKKLGNYITPVITSIEPVKVLMSQFSTQDFEHEGGYEDEGDVILSTHSVSDPFKTELAAYLSKHCLITHARSRPQATDPAEDDPDSDPDFASNNSRVEADIVDLSRLVFHKGQYVHRFSFHDNDWTMVEFFQRYELCRRKSKYILRFNEPQKNLSGLFIDLDVELQTAESPFNSSTYQIICEDLFASLDRMFINVSMLHFAITRKPRIKEIVHPDGSRTFRDGLHILCPSIWMDKRAKRAVLEDIRDAVPYWLGDDANEDFKKALDMNSVTVPVFLLGSAKPGIQNTADVYQLQGIFAVKKRPNGRFGSGNVFEVVDLQKYGNMHLALELSLSYKHPAQGQAAHLLIEKNVYAPSATLSKILEDAATTSNSGGSGDPSTNRSMTAENFAEDAVRSGVCIGGRGVPTDNIAAAALAAAVRFAEDNKFKVERQNDPDFHEILGILDILNPIRYNDRAKWIQVLCALASYRRSWNKLLAMYFSKKSPKYSDADFHTTWQSIIKGTLSSYSDPVKTKIQIGSLYHFALSDNKEAFNDLKRETIFGKIQFQLYGSTLSMGQAGIDDMTTAKLLHTVLGHRIVYDDITSMWYEFVSTPEDVTRAGELYKWICWVGSDGKPVTPSLLPIYISSTFRDICFHVMEIANRNKERYIARLSEETLNSSEGKEVGDDVARLEAQIKTISKIAGKFSKYITDLGNIRRINGIIAALKFVCNQSRFHEHLDRNPMLLGVGNGILELFKDGSPPVLHVGYNNLNVSLYTEVNYVPFDPYDSMVKEVLFRLRAYFPDSEPDSFEYVMMSLARTLDHSPRECILLSLTGCGSNGKTTLLELHANMLGKYMASKMKADVFLDKTRSAGRASPEIYRLKYLRFAYMSETNAGEELNESIVKELTGNEMITGRKLYKDDETFKPSISVVLATNNPVRITGTDRGIKRRWRTLSMKMTFKSGNELIDGDNPYERKEDPNMSRDWSNRSDVLEAYLSIMTWYHCKLHTMYAGQLNNIPQYHVSMETHEYFMRQDAVSNFLANQLIQEEGKFVTESDLKARFRSWYEESYGRKPNNSVLATLGEKLLASDLQSHIQKQKNGTWRAKNLRLLEPTDDLDLVEFPFSLDGFLSKKRGGGDKPESQTIEECYAAICREYDEAIRFEEEVAQ